MTVQKYVTFMLRPYYAVMMMYFWISILIWHLYQVTVSVTVLCPCCESHFCTSTQNPLYTHMHSHSKDLCSHSCPSKLQMVWTYIRSLFLEVCHMYCLFINLGFWQVHQQQCCNKTSTEFIQIAWTTSKILWFTLEEEVS